MRPCRTWWLTTLPSRPKTEPGYFAFDPMHNSCTGFHGGAEEGGRVITRYPTLPRDGPRVEDGAPGMNGHRKEVDPTGEKQIPAE